MKTKKKGSIISLEYAVMLFIIPLFIAAVMVTLLMDQMLNLSIVTQYAFPTKLANTVKNYATLLDGVVLISFAAIVARILLKSFRTNMHPIYGMVGLIALPGLAISLGMASNIVGVFTNLSILGSAVNSFSGSFTLLTNLPTVGTAIAIIVLIVMVGVGRR